MEIQAPGQTASMEQRLRGQLAATARPLSRPEPEGAVKVKMTIPDKNLKAAAQGFEAYFLSMLTSQMRKTLPGNSILSGGQGEKVFQQQLDIELANRMGEQGRLGIASLIYNQLKSRPGTVKTEAPAAPAEPTPPADVKAPAPNETEEGDRS